MTNSSDAATVTRRGERFGWTLLPLSLIAYIAGGLLLLGAIAQAWFLLDSIGDTGPVTLPLYQSVELPGAAGTHHYFGSAYVADGATVVTRQLEGSVSGLDAGTRVLVKVGPLLWAATLCITATAIALTLARLRARETARPASRPLLVAAVALAVGSTVAQVVVAAAGIRVGAIRWDGPAGIDGFRALPDTVFDFTPLGIAVALLAVVLVIRRSEPAPPPFTFRRRTPSAGDDGARAAARADAESAW